MKNSSQKSRKLKTIDNPSADAYRRHLRDRTVDYYTEVRSESEKARRSLKNKARSVASIARVSHHSR